jgi:maleamate amidohydrolase
MMPAIERDEAEFFRSRGYGRRIGYGDRPALLIVDMLRAFTDPAAPLGANLDAEIAACSKLIAAARESGAPVIFSTGAYDDADLRDAGIWAMKIGGLTTLRAGGEGPKIDPRLDFRASDPLVVKKYASCFYGTDLVSRLLAYNVDTLIIGGCTTSGCVRATVVDSVQTGFRPIVVREAVGDRSPPAHNQSLFDMDAKYADVVELDDAIEYFARMKSTSRSITPTGVGTLTQISSILRQDPGLNQEAAAILCEMIQANYGRLCVTTKKTITE